MAGSFNRVFLMGNLTRNVELRSVGGSGSQVANVGLALNRNYTTQSGEKREEVTFVDCEAWGKTAEIMAKYLSKGRPVFIEGRLKLDQWDDKDSGKKQSKLKVVVESFQFVDSKGGASGGGGPGDEGGGDYSDRPQVNTRTGTRASAPSAPIAEDDIPF
ncbi:MAG: single-stranded DNA-binding protein [Planctomycetes bacterium]|nr:single-stranded DNA-binding protein [Planctomycetota bacterium]